MMERLRREGLSSMGMRIVNRGGEFDGEEFELVTDGKENFYISDSRPGRFKSMLVKIDP